MNGLLLIVVVILGVLYFNATSKIDKLESEIVFKTNQIEILNSKISKANEIIENGNIMINEAKDVSGDDYDEMVDALDNLQELEVIE